MVNQNNVGIDTILSFGKYRGKAFWAVLDADFQYVKWLVNDKIITLDNSAFEAYEKIESIETQFEDDGRE